ncbi:MAG: hypothetical protein FWD32_02010 [Firmicutes bacterium]|nr:hypothetical protein [Bacillota bacterium]
MNLKTIKQYGLIEQLFKAHFGDPNIINLYKELATINFDAAADMWELLLSKNIKVVALPQNSAVMVEGVLDTLIKQSQTKTVNYIYDSLPLIKLIYGNNCLAASDNTLSILSGAILSNKIDIADNMLMALRGNTNIDYADRMKAVVEDVFNTYCQNKNTKKPELNRKQKTLLLEFISKVKGPNKLLLEQRIKEL